MAWLTPLAAGPRVVFPPAVAMHVVRLACERQLIAEGIVEDISAATVRRILASHQLKPWRHHLWLYPKQPRGVTFYAPVAELIDL
jgi:hypothetical protein